MFLNRQSKSQTDRYISLLQQVGSLSGLFSDSNVPYLYYRVAEIIFCKAFDATNHSRSDTSVDASKSQIGLGLKTFLNGNGRTFQKVAEFNSDREKYSDMQSRDLARIVSELRNKRIDFAKRAHSVDDIFYHCVTRADSEFYLYEEPMLSIDINKIKIDKDGKNTIHFNDTNAEYNFNISKSTLFKRFYTPSDAQTFIVKILDDPFSFLEQCQRTGIRQPVYQGSVILPLFSLKGRKYVPERSGLNQWNARGRERHPYEAYIPIPKWIHREFLDFFPPRDQTFNLKLPNGNQLSAKVSQDGGKALMSNPNKALGEWLLDEILSIPMRTLVTLDTLEEVGIDSVEVRKIDDEHYEIDFRELGTYEEFEDEYKP
jgi:hypothetical protein